MLSLDRRYNAPMKWLLIFALCAAAWSCGDPEARSAGAGSEQAPSAEVAWTPVRSPDDATLLREAAQA